MVPVRKAGKLPARRSRPTYALEYGDGDAGAARATRSPTGQRVLLVDDVLATGGTLAAAVDLVEQAGGELVAVSVVVELAALGGRDALADLDIQTVLAG